MKKRAIVIVLDSVGIGAAKDAFVYGDVGADTLRHIYKACLASGFLILRSLDSGTFSTCISTTPRVRLGSWKSERKARIR